MSVTKRGKGMADRHWEAGVWVSSADWFKADVARQRAGPTSLGILPRTAIALSYPNAFEAAYGCILVEQLALCYNWAYRWLTLRKAPQERGVGIGEKS